MYYSGKNDFCNKILYKIAFMVLFRENDFCDKILYKRAFMVLFRGKMLSVTRKESVYCIIQGKMISEHDTI